MKKNSLTYIDQESVKADFKIHLDNDLNSRILFSARFGTGKSTFLNNFFEKSDDDYIALKLYPVNYSISHNKDVFELIKYDLIYELLSKYSERVNLHKNEYSTALIAQMFLLHGLKIDPLLKSILKASAPESEIYIDIVNQLSGIVQQYTNYREGVEKSELDILNRYIKQLKNYKGTPHEYDEITEVITSMLSNVKQSLFNDNEDTNVKTVLIIDDIDRLDPEHVFRLFNIFSAHYDSVTDKNKFDFDKVIFVCDYNNIRLMYEHRYGKGVDFSGYIDKFFSTEIFNYNNTKYLKENLKAIFSSKTLNIPDQFKQYLPGRTDFYNAFEYLLIAISEVNGITLRNLEQFDSYNLPNYKVIAGLYDYKYSAADYPFLMLLHLLKKMISPQSLESYLRTLSNKLEMDVTFMVNGNYNAENCQKYLKEISLPFIVETHKFFNSHQLSESEKNGQVTVNDKNVYYTMGQDFRSDKRYLNLAGPRSSLSPTAKAEQTNVFEFLLDALVKSENLIKSE